MRAQIKGESGYALPLAMVSIIIFSIFISVFLGILNHELKVNYQLVNKWQARYVAESGVDNALYKTKIAIQNVQYNNGEPVANSGQPYTVDLTANQFDATATPKLLPLDSLSKNSRDGQIKSSGSGTVKGKDGLTTVGDYKWVIKYQGAAGTTPATPSNPPPVILTNNLTIESVGNYDYIVNGVTTKVPFRVRAVVTVQFQPLLIPYSPVRIEFSSYTEVPTAFGWE